MKQLKDKTAIITGSSRGLGRTIALRFADEGANIVINFYQNDEAATKLFHQIQQVTKNVLVIKADVTRRNDVKTMFNETISHFGRIDILVNNAGVNKRDLFHAITDDDWDFIMNVNLKGPFICCQEVFPYMKEQNYGRIVNISSVAGQYHGPKTVHYAVSKAGLNSLTKVVARYGAPYNILVNAVAPGIMLTDQTADEIASEAGQAIINMTLLKRPGDLNDAASACLFLASDEQKYITGQVISVSGGAVL